MLSLCEKLGFTVKRGIEEAYVELQMYVIDELNVELQKNQSTDSQAPSTDSQAI